MRTLADWLDYQQRIHPRDVELGLERVGEVWRRMGAPRPAPVVVTVGGTNGKGSTVAFLEAILSAAGKRVGCYTSPHLLHYNERVRVLGIDATDATLVDTFEKIETTRKEIALTYFEFGTLAALWIFAQSQLDIAVLEVGLGGRLDAVNLIDADAAIVTTVDLDHMDWLGSDRDSIGREKAGIFRSHRPAIVGMQDPPRGLIAEAERIGADVLVSGRNFSIMPQGDTWCWQPSAIDCANTSDEAANRLIVPDPGLPGAFQIDNAAAAIAAVHALRNRIGWNPQAIAAGVSSARVPARVQRFKRNGCADLTIDVAHNPQAARALAQCSAGQSSNRRIVAVFGALQDKDVGGVITPLLPLVDSWCAVDLSSQSPRGIALEELLKRMRMVFAPLEIDGYASVADALDAAAASSGDSGQIIAFGSFFIAAAALNWATQHGYRSAG